MTEPVQIIEESDSELTIKAELRRSCPCAGCINEWTGAKTLTDESIPDDLTFSHISIVGRYALNFHFSDGHDTGISSFALLQRLGSETPA